MNEILAQLVANMKTSLIGISAGVAVVVAVVTIVLKKTMGKPPKAPQATAAADTDTDTDTGTDADADAPEAADATDAAPTEVAPANAKVAGESPPAGPGRRGARLPESATVGRAFAQSMARLRAATPGQRLRYGMPWILMVGVANSGKASLIHQTGLDVVRSLEDARRRQRMPLTWALLDRGVLISVAGDLVFGHALPGRARLLNWGRLLGQLERNRPLRPLDGIIVCVPADTLAGPGAQEADEHRELAGQIRRRLWELQRRLGMRLPLYVLVTKCDRVTGFSALANALPEQLQASMLGWSVPYSLDAAYNRAWVDEAFDGVRSDLLQVQADVLAERDDVGSIDDLFLLPDAFEGLREGARIYLDELFEDAAHGEWFYLRGVFFTGDAGGQLSPSMVASAAAPQAAMEVPGAPATGAPSLTATGHRRVFLRDLLKDKVFPEHTLGNPLGGFFVQRNRRVLATQAAVLAIAVLGGLGLWWSYQDLGRSAERTVDTIRMVQRGERALAEEKNEVSVAARIPATHKNARGVPDLCATDASLMDIHNALEDANLFVTREGRRLLQGVSAVDPGEHVRVLMPRSWVDPMGNQIRDLGATAFREVVWPSTYFWLNARASEQFAGAHAPGGELGGTFTDSLDSREFARLNRFVVDTARLDGHFDAYRDLRTAATKSGGEPELLSIALRGLLLAAFTVEVEVTPDLLRFALAGVKDMPALCRRVYQPAAQEVGRTLADAFLERAFGSALLGDTRPLVRGLERYQSLESLGQDSGAGLEALNRLALLRSIDAGLDQLRGIFQRPEYAWIASGSFRPGQRYAQLLGLASSTSLLGGANQGSLQQHLRDASRERLVALRDVLTQLSAQGIGPLLEIDENGVPVRLSPNAYEFHQSVESFLSEPFSQPAGDERLATRVAAGQRLDWDVDRVEGVLAASEDYELFLKVRLKEFPRHLRGRAESLARLLIDSHLRASLAQAQRITPAVLGLGAVVTESDIRTEVGNFQAVSEPMVQLVERLERLGLERTRSDLSGLLAYQAIAMLRGVDRLLETEWLYVPTSGVERWLGEPGLAYRAFDFSDDADLGAYLIMQRERAAALAQQFATPMLTYLTRMRLPPELSGNQPLVFRWRRILRDLELYQARQPSSPIASLENFILSEMNGLTAANCLQRLEGRGDATGSGDFFVERRLRLESAVQQRCRAIASDELTAAYQGIAGRFNRLLAGKFPFVRDDPINPWDWLDAADVAPQDVQELYQEFARLPGTLQAVARGEVVTQRISPQAAQFLQQLHAVRNILAPWADYELGRAPPELGFAVEFRVNREREVGGNQIIDWTLAVADKTIRPSDANPEGRWRFGDPVMLSLRWATGSKARPMRDLERIDLSTVDGIARFRYGEGWSLLKLVRANRHDRVPTASGLRTAGDLLRLTVPVEARIDQEAESDAIARAYAEVGKFAQVFVRLVAVGPKGTDREGLAIAIPEFPSLAPGLGPTQSQRRARDPVAAVSR